MLSASTQNQALSALLFLYRAVLHQQMAPFDDFVRAHRRARLPVVLTREEVRRVLGALDGVPRLIARLLYGSGLRLLECLELRVKDLDLERREITVRRGKGDKDRRTVMPISLAAPLAEHLVIVKALHESDLAKGYGRVVLPDALHDKYPNADRS